jgi:hypothetical protein
MAKLKEQIIKLFSRFKKKRPGVHSKKKNSKSKNSKHYKKPYHSQGKK